MGKIRSVTSGSMIVCIADEGAEMQSILDASGEEYLWQGDEAYWEDRAPNIFPYISRLTDGMYTYTGQQYHMDIHGFLKDKELDVEWQRPDAICYRLTEDDETLEQYPFRFVMQVQYELKSTRLDITYRVQNRDDKTMYFGIGGHPGFRVPLQESERFEEYRLAFGGKCHPMRVGMSDDCFVTGEDRPFPLADDRFLPLDHAMFDDDAIVLYQMDRTVTLERPGSSRSVAVHYPDMPYLGLWHRPHTSAPYVCIEPWSSLPSRKGVVEDLQTQPGLIALAPGKVYCNAWSIEIK